MAKGPYKITYTDKLGKTHYVGTASNQNEVNEKVYKHNNRNAYEGMKPRKTKI